MYTPELDKTGESKMRNKFAEDVLDNDKLFLIKTYQVTLDNSSRLSFSDEVLKKNIRASWHFQRCQAYFLPK